MIAPDESRRTAEEILKDSRTAIDQFRVLLDKMDQTLTELEEETRRQRGRRDT